MRSGICGLLLAVAALALAAGASARHEGDAFSGSFSCSVGGGVCTGTIVDPAGGPTIEGFYLGPGAFTGLQVDGHAGNVGPNGPGGAEEILFNQGAFVTPGTTATFSFQTTAPPSSLIVTPTYDQRTYGDGVTFTSSTHHSCTAQSARVSRLKKKIKKLEKKIANATGAHKASLEEQLASAEKALARAEHALSSCEQP